MDLLDNKFLSVFDYIVIENKFYFSNNTFNAFVEVDLRTNQVMRIEEFKGASLYEDHLHYKCIAYHNKLFFFCVKIPRIHMIDLQDGKQQIINTKEIISEGIIYDDVLYFMPWNLKSGIWYFDPMSNDVQDVPWWKETMDKEWFEYYKINDCSWMGCCIYHNTLLYIDFQKKTIEERTVSGTFFRMDYDNENENVWYFDANKNSINCFSKDRPDKISVMLQGEPGITDDIVYQDITVYDGKVFLVSGNIDKIYYFDNREMAKICDLQESRTDNWIARNRGVLVKKTNNQIYYTFANREVVAKIDINNLSVEQNKLSFNNQDIVTHYLNRVNIAAGVISSEKNMDLNEYLGILLEQEDV